MRLGAPLVEREDLIEGLVVAVTACADGEQVAVIEGPAGIGKSRLLEAVCERADEFEVLRARGGVLEEDIAFGVVRELLERRLVLASEAERQEVMTGAAVGAAPVLGLAAADGRRAGTGDLSGALHGLFWVVANLADRRPLLIAVDDLHWADRGSLEFLAFLARRIQGLPVFLATAVPGRAIAPRGGHRRDLGARARDPACATEPGRRGGGRRGVRGHCRLT